MFRVVLTGVLGALVQPNILKSEIVLCFLYFYCFNLVF